MTQLCLKFSSVDDMSKVSKIWMIIAILFIGYSGGIITGVVIDADQVYHTTIKNIRQKKSQGTIVIDVDTHTGEQKTKKQIRKENKEDKLADRAIRKAARKNKKK